MNSLETTAHKMGVIFHFSRVDFCADSFLDNLLAVINGNCWKGGDFTYERAEGNIFIKGSLFLEVNQPS